MKLHKIKLNQYKSIKKPIEISLDDNNIFTFIGKNGSGKTNILQALKKTLTKSTSYYQTDKEPISSQFVLKVSEEEKRKYFSIAKSQFVSDEILVDFVSDDIQVRRIEAPILEMSIEKYRHSLKDLLKKLKNATRIYIDKLKSIEVSYDDIYYVSLKVKNERGLLSEITNNQINYIKENVKRQIEDIEKFFQQNFQNGFKLNNSHAFFNSHIPIWPIDFYQLSEEKELLISPIVAKSLSLNKNDIEIANKKLNEEIKKTNAKLKLEYDNIKKCLQEFENIKKEILRIFSEQEDKNYTLEEEIQENHKQFCKLLRTIVFNTGYYLDNEDSLLFYNHKQNYYKEETTREYLNARNPIIESMHEFLIANSYYKEGESLLDAKTIEKSRLKYLENIINKEFFADFEGKEINGYRVEFLEGNTNLFVKEKTGEEINLDSTSLGRRWYLTYAFVKKLLKAGDCLFIDEPAAFLHPEAQVELRKELEEISKRGILVFITTHSPYMIPANWQNVYNVSMTDSGTEIKAFIEKDDLCEAIKQNLGISRTSDILFNLSKTFILVEGYRDKLCIEKLARKCNFDLSEYMVMTCDGSTIIPMTYICIIEQVKFKTILDNDNKYKPQEWLKNHCGYKESLDIIENNSNCIFVPLNGKGKCLEDCFSSLDADRYFSEVEIKSKKEMKIDCKKISDGEVFDEETLDNFEQLFIALEIPKLDKK